jgi:hypothetical protein
MGGRVFDKDMVALDRSGMCDRGAIAAGMVSKGLLDVFLQAEESWAQMEPQAGMADI